MLLKKQQTTIKKESELFIQQTADQAIHLSKINNNNNNTRFVFKFCEIYEIIIFICSTLKY